LSKYLTVAIPTHNRSHLLARTLASVADLRLPEGVEAECIIIDNNSTDDTEAVVARFGRDSALRVRHVVERRQGSSFARNRAVDEARGDIILFVDDDAIAEPTWAIEMIAEMERRKVDVACGMVVPQWTVPPPRWLGPSLYIRLAVHDEERLVSCPREQLESVHNYFSANVAFRRETFERFGRFREDLGVVGGNPMSGEDTELFERILERGGVIGFVPGARVHHIIGRERMTRAYLRHKSYAFGYGSAIAGGPTHNHLDKLVRNAARMALAAMRGNFERVVYHELECANFFGYWRGRLALRR
jgi:glucosyl-dolichyl phosphate glucuronosyltransferase